MTDVTRVFVFRSPVLLALLTLGLLFATPAAAQEETQQEVVELTPPSGSRNFGTAVSLSADGELALLGARGKAYIYARRGEDNYSLVAELAASDGAAGDAFGRTVSLSADGQTALVGAPEANVNGSAGQGSAYLFERRGENSYAQIAKITAVDGMQGDAFGGTVSLSADGRLVLVGAVGDDVDGNANQGSAYVFARGGESSYMQITKITATDGMEDDLFGSAVSLSADGQVALIGASLDSQEDDDLFTRWGSAYVFERRGESSYTQIAKLTEGSNSPEPLFGNAVSLNPSGEYALVGAERDVQGRENQGSAHLFVRRGENRYEEVPARFTTRDSKNSDAENDFFGASVSLSADGRRALVGAPGDEPFGLSSARRAGPGAVHVFDRQGDGGYEREVKFNAPGDTNRGFGEAVSLSADGQLGLIGAPGTKVNGNSGQGSAYIYRIGEEDGGGTMADTTPPVCGAIDIERNGAGVLTAIETSATDSESGIDLVRFTTLDNLTGFLGGGADGSVPRGPFSEGDTEFFGPDATETVTIRGERVSFEEGGTILTEVTNGAGLSSQCDPVTEQLSSTPAAFALEGNYPNPVRNRTTITFSLPEAAAVTLEVFDMLGRQVATLADGEKLPAGTHGVKWEAAGLSSGTYVYHIEAGDFTASRRMMLVR